MNSQEQITAVYSLLSQMEEMHGLLLEMNQAYQRLFESWDDICYDYQRQSDTTIEKYQKATEPMIERAAAIMATIRKDSDE